MVVRLVLPATLCRRGVCRLSTRLFGSGNTRNVGIIAHIDAGKTTTTERMLLLAGAVHAAGEVDSGDTVTDFLEQERERGITIQSAATSFGWRGAAVSLIDTPGHIDFTVEVERAVRVLDGAVLIVDAVAGAQAQTETVWRQARRHGVPAVAFVNKMDREGADWESAASSLATRLQLRPLRLQLPLYEPAGTADGAQHFVGAVDLVSGVAMRWRPRGAQLGTGSRSEVCDLELTAAAAAACEAASSAGLALLQAEGEAAVCEAAEEARAALVEEVAELDPDGEVADLFLAEEAVPAATLAAAIRQLALCSAAVPTLCGASLRGVGVEPLLDAVAAYLPSAEERPAPLLSPEGGGGGEGGGGEGGGGEGGGGGSGAASGVPLAAA
ncbi:putative mitochondrial elongation factor, partial [Emiliania huxleyi CCMP1516]|uniref:Tr-type G domain-containing protein n=2 Tax=Emiliania huxleyi TaxID=2903 RepID=A0A0D3K3D2_EMIH1